MRRSLMTACAWTALTAGAFAQDLAPLNSDTETDRIDWSELESKFGAVPSRAEGTQVGGVSKTLTNEYWRALGEGYQSLCRQGYGVDGRLSGGAERGRPARPALDRRDPDLPGLQRPAVLAADRRQPAAGHGDGEGGGHPGRQRQRRGDPDGRALCRQRPARQRRARRQVVPREPCRTAARSR